MAGLFAGKYAIYIWPAYGITVLVFLVLIVSTLRRARYWKRIFEARGGK
jgi:heme exporter protein D